MLRDIALYFSIVLGFTADASEVVTRVTYNPKDGIVGVEARMSDGSYVDPFSLEAAELKAACNKKMDEVISFVKDADILKTESFCNSEKAGGLADGNSPGVEVSSGALYLRSKQVFRPLMEKYMSDCLADYSSGNWITAVKLHASEICRGDKNVDDYAN
jgi:hypothetical protein